MAALSVDTLRKTYGAGEAQVHALDGVDVAFNSGDFTAIMGASGSSKSTLLHLFAKKFPATAGELLFGAKTEVGLFAQYDDLPEDDQDRHIGDILYDAAPGGTPRVKIRTLLGTLLFSGDDAEKPYRVLSGGEKARVRLGLLLLRFHAHSTNFIYFQF